MHMAVDEVKLKKESLAKDIIGEIAMSADPPKTIKKWRSLFRASQKDLSKEMGVTSSVISDYESGRRKSPGILFMKKYVEALMRIDERSGGEIIRGFLHISGNKSASSAIADIKEFDKGKNLGEFIMGIGGRMISGGSMERGEIYGYTVVDSVKAITELSFSELLKLYGVTTERAIIFTNVTTGKGPMIAIKIGNLRPALVVLHNITETQVSDVAKNIASLEGIPLAVCDTADVDTLLEKLKSC